MNGEGKRSDAGRPKPPRPSSILLRRIPLTSTLFTQHTPSLFELFLVDLAFGEPFLEDVQGRLARRAVKSIAMPWPTEVIVKPLNDVDDAFAWDEGEGDAQDAGVVSEHFHGTRSSSHFADRGRQLQSDMPGDPCVRNWGSSYNFV